MHRENYLKSDHAQWYFKLFNRNPLFIHCVECRVCFTTVNEGKYNLNFHLLGVNLKSLGLGRENLRIFSAISANLKHISPREKFDGSEFVREI